MYALGATLALGQLILIAGYLEPSLGLAILLFLAAAVADLIVLGLVYAAFRPLGLARDSETSAPPRLFDYVAASFGAGAMAMFGLSMVALGSWLYIGLHGWGLHPVLSVAITLPLMLVGLFVVLILSMLLLGLAIKDPKK
ncbi:hypothetical protein BCD49_34800 [Pseudofrankia sp. EUN1h]|nr:hypothetical protein BCD49_34800 [Pseudofrankia sp. EUN1h]